MAFLDGKYKEKDNQISIVSFLILALNVISGDERIKISKSSTENICSLFMKSANIIDTKFYKQKRN